MNEARIGACLIWSSELFFQPVELRLALERTKANLDDAHSIAWNRFYCFAPDGPLHSESVALQPAETRASQSLTALMAQGILSRWTRYARQHGLTPDTKEYRAERRQFIGDAVNAGFLAHFGKNMGDPVAWHSLCVTIGVEGAQDMFDIKECKAALKGIYINIVELVDAAEAGETVAHKFQDEESLRAFTKQAGMTYPLGAAIANPFLRKFLIKVYT
ncbi:uncharacterized protein SCHCODRAFT_01193121 [Schizophyllum commune H4-8]|nr:uncharacterized protein SCHCODRAFT_01193121 [Schizophyllum commune H4-8]KAI5887237.1 hypothetical protein SCHCODRAFT_01193121 [Schizophyllum commune H4-8]